ncbi:MAG: response regulator [Azonexus sp.]|nr:response regulator [Azonexus sp.]
MDIEERRLLLIDDDENYREVLGRSLSRQGFIVSAAATAGEALLLCRIQDPEYVILDLNLAGQSGLNLIQPLLDIAPGARILVLTGYASIPTAVSALKLGATQYLPKPADVREIVRALLDQQIDLPDIIIDERMTVQHLEWEYIQRTLQEHGGNIAATARALKMHRRSLQRKLAKKRPPEQEFQPA